MLTIRAFYGKLAPSLRVSKRESNHKNTTVFLPVPVFRCSLFPYACLLPKEGDHGSAIAHRLRYAPSLLPSFPNFLYSLN